VDDKVGKRINTFFFFLLLSFLFYMSFFAIQ
jgi:hypothetical protein